MKNLENYPFRKTEEKWNEKELKKFPYNEGKKKYILPMLPYPSGKFHMGHMLVYTLSDVFSRYFHYLGHKTYCFMGWDSFGLPAENAAIERKILPEDWISQKISEMKIVLMKMGFLYRWDEEINTSSENYYSKQQKLFIEMYEKGWLIKEKGIVNWDPMEKTVLANEQVNADGTAWRSKAKVEQKVIEQWFFKISDFAEELLSSIKTLEGKWPQKILKMQENWIGKSYGTKIKLKITSKSTTHEYLEIYTTRPETIFGCTFVGVSRQTAIEIFNNYEDIKVGKVIIPESGKEVDVYVADYVLTDYGVGAVIGVPAHDERDANFAKENNLNIINVIDINDKMENSGKYNKLDFKEFRDILFEKYGIHTMFKLRNWCVSRQRYWGCPIPMNYCPRCGVTPEKNLPVLLPKQIVFGEGNPMETDLEWRKSICSKCGGEATRETDTLDTFVDSAWYFMAYLDKKKNENINIDFDKDILPVDIYIGGPEHATLHMLYARFFTKRMKDLGYVDIEEPFSRFITNGMICAPTYVGKESGNYYFKNEIGETKEEIVIGKSEKMSKSMKNGEDPLQYIEEYGADSLRLFIVSDSPIGQDIHWNDNGIKGCWRFLNKVWNIGKSLEKKEGEKIKEYEDILKSAQEDMANEKINTYIAKLRIFINSFDGNKESFRIFLILFSIICPHICSELYEILFFKNIFEEKWPTLKKKEKIEEKIIFSINGKKKGIVLGEKESTAKEIITLVERKYGKIKYKKYVYVPLKVINFIK